MRVLRVIAVIAIGLVLAPASMAAIATQDVVATSTFLTAATRFYRADLGLFGRERAAQNAFITHIRTTCPHAIPGSLKTGTARQQAVWFAFSLEAVFELGMTGFDAAKPAVRPFDMDLSRLRWTDPALNRSVRTVTLQFSGLLSVRSPDLCDQASQARTSDFSGLPPASRHFLNTIPVTTTPGGDGLLSLARKMRPYVTRADSGAFQRFLALDARIGRSNPSSYERRAENRIIRAFFS